MTANLIAATTDPLPCFQFQGKSLLMCYWAASNHYSKLLVVQSSLIFFKFIHRECYPCQGYGEYCIIVGWDAGAAAIRFRGRGQASRVPWLYGTVPYGWAEHTNSVAL